MKKNSKTIALIAFLSFSFSSCDKWLDIKPADRIVEENIFNNESGFLAALNGVYSDLLKSDLYGSALTSEFIEIIAQQYNIRATNVNYTELAAYGYTNTYSKGRLERIWDSGYKTILNCNKIIENAEKNKTLLPSKSHAIILGESIAIRSFLHFDLLRLFGPIYKTSSQLKSIPYVDKISVSPAPLNTAAEVAQFLLSDLTKAEDLLKSADPIVSEGPQTEVLEGVDNTFRFRTLRFNYYAVLALKARIYLYIGDRENALKYSKMILEDPNTQRFFPFIKYNEILGNPANPDRVFSTEILFGLFNTNRNTIFQNYFNPDATQPTNLLIPRPGNITALFSGEENDYRNYPIWKNSNLEANAMYTMKYRSGETATLYRNNIMPLLRLGELYLIAAEAESDSQKAYAYLNKLRGNRGLNAVSDNLTARIRNEYIKEFHGEGQLFFFYKRNNITPIRSGITNNNLTMTAARYVPLLPDSENRYRD